MAVIRYRYAILPMIPCRRNLHGSNHTNFTMKAGLHEAFQEPFVKFVLLNPVMSYPLEVS